MCVCVCVSVCVCLFVCVRVCVCVCVCVCAECVCGSARDVMVTVVPNGLGDTSSISERDFALLKR